MCGPNSTSTRLEQLLTIPMNFRQMSLPGLLGPEIPKSVYWLASSIHQWIGSHNCDLLFSIINRKIIEIGLGGVYLCVNTIADSSSNQTTIGTHEYNEQASHRDQARQDPCGPGRALADRGPG